MQKKPLTSSAAEPVEKALLQLRSSRFYTYGSSFGAAFFKGMTPALYHCHLPVAINPESFVPVVKSAVDRRINRILLRGS